MKKIRRFFQTFFFQNNFEIPIVINRTPEIIAQILFGILVRQDNFSPIKDPKLKNIIWNIDIKSGKRNEVIPIALHPTPAQKESIEIAEPKYRASLASI